MNMINEKNIPFILVSLFLFIIIGFVGIFAGIHHHIKARSPDDFTIEKKELDSHFRLERKTNNAENYTLRIDTLLTEHETINESMLDWLQMKERQFLNRVDQHHNMLQEQQAQLHIAVDLNKVDANFYNITFRLKENIAGKRKKEVKTFNIDLIENKIVNLTDILNMEWGNLEKLLFIVKKQFKEKGKEWEKDYWLKWSLVYPEQLNWHINQNVLTFYESSSPYRKVEIPVQYLNFCLSDPIVERLNIQFFEGEAHALDPNGKYIALTFDDGPSPDVTPQVLEILKAYGAKATFFMLASQAEYHPELAKRVADEGHEIGNHTINHPNLAKLGKEQIRKEIEESSHIIENITGQSPVYFRPPYGIYNDAVAQIAFENSSPIILWSVDSLDWKHKNAENVKQLVLQGIAPGSIILLHDIHPTTADALSPVLEILHSYGYQFITVSELMILQELNGIGPYYSVTY